MQQQQQKTTKIKLNGNILFFFTRGQITEAGPALDYGSEIENGIGEIW